jgi:hypothetical protein
MIRWGLCEDCSHFAIMFFEGTSNEVVIESRLQDGVREKSFSDFIDDGKEIVHALQFPLGSEVEEHFIYEDIRNELVGQRYDSYAIGYWFIAGLAYRLGIHQLPLKNKWGKNELVYCVEVLQAMPELLLDVGVDLDTFDLEMTSPHMAFEMLTETGMLRDVTEYYLEAA